MWQMCVQTDGHTICLDLLRFTRCIWLLLHTLKHAARAKLATEHRCLLTQFDFWERRCAAEIKSFKRDVKSHFLVSPLCLILKELEPPRRTWMRHFTVFHWAPAEVKANEASGGICLDLAHWRCKVCSPSTLRVLICLRKAPGHLQICKNVTSVGRLRVTSSHSYLMAPLLKASFASCGVFIFTSRVPVITYKCCCHLVQLFTVCPDQRGPGSRGPESTLIIGSLLLSWRERRENYLFSI